MHRRNQRRITTRHRPSRWVEKNGNNFRRQDENRPGSATTDAAFEFGRFRVLLRQRQLLADKVPVELGTRAFDLLLALLESDGSLISKETLISRVWRGIVVSEENLKVQVSALRKALGADRDLIRTEFGRGYRFTGALRMNTVTDAREPPARPNLRSDRTLFPLARFPLACRQSLRCGFSFELMAEGGGRN